LHNLITLLLSLHNTLMRHSFKAICCALLVTSVAGCASVPASLQLINAAKDQDKATHHADCLLPPAAAVPVNTAAALDPTRIAVLNWNVYKGQRSNWAEDFKQLVMRHDIILLQEALLNESLESQLQEQQLYWTLNHSFKHDDNETGVLTAARISPQSSCGLRITEPLIRTPKTTLVQTYNIAGEAERLMVANIHGINFTLGMETYAQQMQALQAILARHRGPVILAGDFNNWSEERTAVLQDMANALQLVAIPYTNHNRTRVFGHAIDHVYYRGLDVISHQSIDVTSSDHNPIQVLFSFHTQQLVGQSP
jgi:endonuclease/exonuclease/phosphatase (EEP) superfamily protein YafD